ncbi:unnamed protein product [Orchesella dallaii]|uniref:Metal transporter CNNM4 n=1 Tax=Orchesella dallaii TaxID=48710 RepID=A0ABP1QLD2_9HEXA
MSPSPACSAFPKKLIVATLLLYFLHLPPVIGNWLSDDIHIIGFSILPAEARKRSMYDVDGYMHVMEDMEILIRLFGKFKDVTYFKFTKSMSDCDRTGEEVELHIIEGSEHTVSEAKVTLPSKSVDSNLVYMCLREGSSGSFQLQGSYIDGSGKEQVCNWLVIKLLDRRAPIWVLIMMVVGLLSLSALFSGLNLGLLSLDKTDLKVIINTGSQRERSQASKIVPVRNHGNYLLCCLVFSNVLVNTTLALVTDELTPSNGSWESIIYTTFGIVIFGEIIPQAVCSRYGLAVGAETILITKFFMFVTFPLAYPIGKLLDSILGEEIGAVYTRDRLKELLKVTRDQHGLEREEMGIISGALEMKSKTVKDIMTPLDDIFMLPVEACFDFDVLTEIESRGSRGHMAFVQKLIDEGPGDPRYETVGLVTMEDVLEELLQAEIYDENDVGRSHGKTQKTIKSLPYKYRKTRPVVHISPQLSFAATQYLVTLVEPFKNNKVSLSVIQRLMGTNIQFVKLPKAVALLHPDESTVYLYEAGKATGVFTMIIEGRVRVEVGKEKLTYDSGPFTTFGVDLLMSYKADGGIREAIKNSISRTPGKNSEYVPDYTVKALADLHVLKLTAKKYRQACIATEQERMYSNNPQKAAEKPTWAEEIAAILDAED